MKDKLDVLHRGVLVLLPEPDDIGRAIIYFNPSLKRGDEDDKVFNMLVLLFFNFNYRSIILNDLMYFPPFLKSYRLLNCGGI